MSGIFISYRRDDTSGHAGRLADRLKEHFSPDQVFMDVDSIQPGEDFEQAIEDKIASCDVLLVMIGQEWLHATNSRGELRLAQPKDFVRLEITAALRRNTRVIPVLVQKATMPTEEDLPADLAPLARRQAVELRDTRWDADVDWLITVLKRTIAKLHGARKHDGTDVTTLSRLLSRRAGIVGGAALLLALGIVATVIFIQRSDALTISHGTPTSLPAHTPTAVPPLTPILTPLEPPPTIPDKLVASWPRTGHISAQGVTIAGGQVYVANYGTNRIEVYTTTGQRLSLLDAAGLRRPTGIAIDRQGSLYVADSENNRIVKLAPDGHQLASWGTPGSGPGQFDGVHSVAVAADGDILAADFGNNRIQKLGPNGNVLGVWGGRGSAPGQYQGPVDVTVDRWGNVYVADFYNGRVQKLTPNGRFLAQFRESGATRTGPVRPHGVAVDDEGRVYVADFIDKVVRVLSPGGRQLAHIGSSSMGNPVDVTLNAAGDLYVATQSPDQILKFSPLGSSSSPHG